MDAANNYFVTIIKDGKVKEQHYCETIDQVKTLQAVARSKNCTLNYIKLTSDVEETKDDVEVQEKVNTTEESPKTRDGFHFKFTGDYSKQQSKHHTIKTRMEETQKFGVAFIALGHT